MSIAYRAGMELNERKILSLAIRFLAVWYTLWQVEGVVNYFCQGVFAPRFLFNDASMASLAAGLIRMAAGVAMFRFAGRLVRFAYPPSHVTGHCPVCGYDMRATPNRCPECGTAATSHL